MIVLSNSLDRHIQNLLGLVMKNDEIPETSASTNLAAAPSTWSAPDSGSSRIGHDTLSTNVSQRDQELIS